MRCVLCGTINVSEADEVQGQPGTYLCLDRNACIHTLRRQLTPATPAPVIDDPRDTNLASDCAPTYIVEYGSKPNGRVKPARRTFVVDDIAQGKRYIADLKQHACYCGPYYIHESRIRHEE